jgi:hypothetical protein
MVDFYLGFFLGAPLGMLLAFQFLRGRRPRPRSERSIPA